MRNSILSASPTENANTIRQHAYATAICETHIDVVLSRELLDRQTLSLTMGSVSRRASTIPISPDKDGASSTPTSSNDNLPRDAVACGDYGDLRALELPDRHQVDGASSQGSCTAGRRCSSTGLPRSAWQVGQTRFWSAGSVGGPGPILWTHLAEGDYPEVHDSRRRSTRRDSPMHAPRPTRGAAVPWMNENEIRQPRIVEPTCAQSRSDYQREPKTLRQAPCTERLMNQDAGSVVFPDVDR